jgi:hypothetical protein
MGLLNDLWWLSGLALAAPIAVVALEYFGGGDTLVGVAFVALALVALLLPEYVRWQLFGGSSVLEYIPGIGEEGEA